MSIVLIILGVLSMIAGLVCSIMVVMEAADDEIWKGLLCLIIWIYWLYYAIFEFEHEKKWLIVGTALCGNSLGLMFFIMAALTKKPA